ncbi:DUF6232 family protein [Micromonospora zhanjiangensis]|uniref:DUF6232 family protein n=1 Tax=Micromonospora zhanjiangensis TaxID=1522057 RepID=A0ABV8KM63_9ACTN
MHYATPEIQVTAEHLTVAGRRYPVRELSDLRTARGRRDPLGVRAAGATGVVLVAVVAVLYATTRPDRPGAVGYLTLAAAAVLPGLLVVLGRRLRPPDYELWGHYRGQTVLLFRSAREREFGQVSRALLRAWEAAGPGAG